MFDYLKQIDISITLFLNGSESTFIDGIAITATNTITWIPIAVVLLYLLFKNNHITDVLFIILGIALAILLADQMASGICKPLFCRYRPTHNPAIMQFVDIVNNYRGGKYGFFSSHAANTFAVATFLTYLIKEKWTAILFFSWAILNCWTRIYLGVHFVSDILVGIIWGIIVGIFSFKVFMTLRNYYYSVFKGETNTPIVSYLISDIKVLNIAIIITYLAIPIIGLFVVHN